MTSIGPTLLPVAPVLDLSIEATQIQLEVPDMPHIRRAAQSTWMGRMVNEHASGRVFDQLATQLAASGAGDAKVTACRGFAAEERRHGVLCAAVAHALGADVRAAARIEEELPAHADAASTVEATLRNVLSISCLSETIAVTIISAEREQMPDGDVKRVLSQILADEIGHARFGWGWASEVMPTMDAAARARLGRYLEVAFAHVEQHELRHLPDTGAPPEGAEAVGLCSGREARELFYDTVTEVIVPRLESMGLGARRAWSDRRRAA